MTILLLITNHLTTYLIIHMNQIAFIKALLLQEPLMAHDDGFNTLTFLISDPLTCNVFFISCLPLTSFDDLIVPCNLLCGMYVLFECRRIILCAMLCIVSWSQGLVMAKDPCEATIIKRLAWLVEQLVVSSHEFSFILF